MKKIHMLWKNLIFRLVLACSLAIIPVNVLAAAVTGMISENYEESLTASYDSQLELYVRALESELSHLESKVGEFLSGENMAVLTIRQESDSSVDLIRLSNEIDEIRSSVQINGMSYLWNHEDDNVSVRMNAANRYGIADVEAVRSIVLNRERVSMGVSAWEITEADGRMFFIRHFDYPCFSFGLLLDAESMLEDLEESSREITETISFADMDGRNLVTVGDGQTDAPDGGEIRIERKIGDLGYSLVRSIRRSDMLSQLPVFVTVIRALAVLSFLALPLLWFVIRRQVVNPLTELWKGMYAVKNGDLEYRLEGTPGTSQMDYIYRTFNSMTAEIKNLTIESYEKELEKLQTESLNILLEVNPHMLLNFLNTIYSLASASRLEEVKSFTLLLVSHFRYILRREKSFVTVREEMNFVTNFMEIQKMRFPDSFTSVYDVDEEAQNVEIPCLLIENFVENSIKYGLVLGKTIEILINIHVRGERLDISICDTGNGMDEERAAALQRGETVTDERGKHIGIWNCLHRLRLYYGENAEFRITSRKGEGTQVWISLPLTPPESGGTALDDYKRKRERKNDMVGKNDMEEKGDEV